MVATVVGVGQNGNLPNEIQVSKEIAAILHGTVQGVIISAISRISRISLSLEKNKGGDRNLDADSLRNVLGEVVNVLKDANEEVRKISHELYPAIVSQGLCPAMRSLADRFYGAIATNLNGLEEIGGREKKMNGKMFVESFLVTVYKCVEESLNNAIKHGKASEAGIEFIFSQSWLVVKVSDNGCGFDPKNVRPGSFGFANAQSYTANFGGSWNVESREGHGTVVSYNFPIGEILATH